MFHIDLKQELWRTFAFDGKRDTNLEFVGTLKTVKRSFKEINQRSNDVVKVLVGHNTQRYLRCDFAGNNRGIFMDERES